MRKLGHGRPPARWTKEMRKKKKTKEPDHDGRVVNAFTWGTGEGGQLGYGLEAPISQDVPRPVFPIGAEVGRHVVRAAAGGRHSLFLLESSDVLACGVWDDGQLGFKDRPVVFMPGTLEEMIPLPKSLVPRGVETSPVQVKVPAKLVVKELAAGFASSFLLTDFGEVCALYTAVQYCSCCRPRHMVELTEMLRKMQIVPTVPRVPHLPDCLL